MTGDKQAFTIPKPKPRPPLRPSFGGTLLFRSPFPINSPVLLAERKWLLLGIASHMSLCNATEHSLLKRLSSGSDAALKPHRPRNVHFNVNSVAGRTNPNACKLIPGSIAKKKRWSYPSTGCCNICSLTEVTRRPAQRARPRRTRRSQGG